MPNYCDYDIRIKGSPRAVQRMVWCLRQGYSYADGKKPAHKHFFRVFECHELDTEKNSDGTITKHLWGNCAWSVQSCMTDSPTSYYADVLKAHQNDFMGTCLAEQSRQCDIEVFSEEMGMCFSEHYLYMKGECMVDDTVQIAEAGYDDDGNITENIDWDTYSGDIVILNEHRDKSTGDYKWTI